MPAGCASRVRQSDSGVHYKRPVALFSGIIPAMQTSRDRFDLDALPSPIRAASLAERAARQDAEARADRLEHLLLEFKRALYGEKSERLTQDQLELAFEDLEAATAEAQFEIEAAKSASGDASNKPKGTLKTGPRRNLGHLPKELPRIEQIIEPDSIQCSNDCEGGCGAMARISEDRSERLDIVPARFQVIVTIRPKYACQFCQENVVQVPAPARLIEGALPSEGTIAHVLVSKYADHLPLYRQSQIYARSGLDLHRSTLAGWVSKAAFHLRPVVEAMATELKTSTKLFMDETTAPVLDPGRGKTKTGYLWALARDDRGWNGNDPPGVIFNYAPGRGGKHGEDFLCGFNGILQVDGYGGYNRLTRESRIGGDPLVLAYCWAHARRKLFDLADKNGTKGCGSGIALEGIKQIAELYRIEAEIRGKTAVQRLAARQACSAPIVATAVLATDRFMSSQFAGAQWRRCSRWSWWCGHSSSARQRSRKMSASVRDP